MLFTYHVISVVKQQPVGRGNFDAATVETAREIAQTSLSLSYEGSEQLEVRLFGAAGNEIWRGPYLGPDFRA